MESELGNVGAVRATFAHELRTLKHKGSNLLLVGSGSGAHEAVCPRLCGQSAHESRYRLFVTDDAARCTDHRGDGQVRTIEYTDPASGTGGSDGDRTPLGYLGTEIIDTIDEFEEDVGGFEPSELRVCVDSLVPLLQEYDTEDVFRLVHVVTARVEQARGMGHYHLPVSRDHDAVVLLEPMFDAVVELRTRGNTHEQQWHLRDQDTETDWIRL
ncbi:DUF7504 family protein [Natrarchaeobius chitinivorans]|uniref:Uncharacterized protein n=1 Tax=Natrarchaeobius chitinivorans TaxID=1679083 RepID=A0A3N6LMR7_NATCH|nr:hypothetical protein [Natrarchaeobius chitinivorans]RQG90513.1 hypothetical protein EA473_21010 [Natrarchaeobius chitinivorans]